MQYLLIRLKSLDRIYKRGFLLTADLFLLSTAHLTLHFYVVGDNYAAKDLSVLMPFALNAAITLMSLYGLGIYNISVRFLSSKIWLIATKAATVSTLLVVLLSWTFNLGYDPLPLAAYWCGLFANLTLFRILASGILNYGTSNKDEGLPCGIYGAGETGRQLVDILRSYRKFNPVVFIDDNPNIQGMYIKGLRVVSAREISQTHEAFNIKSILIAIPNLPQKKLHAVLKQLSKISVKVLMAPNLAKLISNDNIQSQIRSVTIEDLVGRQTVDPNDDLMAATISGKEVLITGAGGSIGSELCRQIITQNPKKIILLDLSEFALYRIYHELLDLSKKLSCSAEMIPMIGSVQNEMLIERIFMKFDIFSVFHAAAYKHVPIVEMNVTEALQNNIFGTLVIARAATRAGISHFTLVSTDKAVRPANFMGATKRWAELICQALQQTHSETKFSIVRFGNVFGSSGSVIPAFQKQISKGGPITITHPEITRFFMSIPEAAQLVIQASALARDGEVFTLDMGEPIKILDIATEMARLYGMTPIMSGEDDSVVDTPARAIEIKVTGLRPGEKLYEELFIDGIPKATVHPRIKSVKESFLPMDELEIFLTNLQDAVVHNNLSAIKDVFFDAPIQFLHNGEIVDVSWDASSD